MAEERINVENNKANESDEHLPVGSGAVGYAVTPTEVWDSLFWSYNLPLQMFGKEDGTWNCLNYMPRKGRCQDLGQSITKEELPQFCKNTASRLRNLADLFEALGDDKIKHIYYPDETVEEAIKQYTEDMTA